MSAGKGKRDRTKEKLSLNNALTKALRHRASEPLHTHSVATAYSWSQLKQLL